MVLYTCNKDKNTNTKQESGVEIMEQEKERLVKEAGRWLKDGRTIRECKNVRLKNMMKQVSANAVLIDLCELNHIIVSNICDGDFESVQPHIEEITDRLATCLAIMKAKGENLNEVATDEQIDYAVEYTIFEQTRRSDE